MNCINRVTLVGFLGQDSSYRLLTGGVSTATLYLATADAYKDAEGKWVQQTEWHTLIVWGKLAEYVKSNLRKGMRVYAEGKLKRRSYELEGIGRKQVTEIIVDRIFSLDSNKASRVQEL
jgi:single-strand DNA-binding protein